MRFAKGHGTGNDFIVVPDADGRLDLGPDAVRLLCDRRRGIGADGVLRAVRADAVRAAGTEPGLDLDGAAWFMDYRNADGSIAEMCGNGIRVFALYLTGSGLAAGPDLAIATRTGVRRVRREADGVFTADMGPVTTGGTSWAVVGDRKLTGLMISVGNPHLACVVTDALGEFDISAPPEVDPEAFPAGVNVELVRMTGDRSVEMRVHERGSGETLSCGTGAVAAAAAAAAAAGNRPARPEEWTVDVPGGRLAVVLIPPGQPDPAVVPSTTACLLTGPAEIVAEGEISDSWLAGIAADTAVSAAV
jgi:diaminopimelate epimerase